MFARDCPKGPHCLHSDLRVGRHAREKYARKLLELTGEMLDRIYGKALEPLPFKPWLDRSSLHQCEAETAKRRHRGVGAQKPPQDRHSCD